MDIVNLRKTAFRIASEHGLVEKDKPIEEELLMVVTEVGEMVQAFQNDRNAMSLSFLAETEGTTDNYMECFDKYIKDTAEDEMADVAIRIMTILEKIGMESNPSIYDEHFIEFHVAQSKILTATYAETVSFLSCVFTWMKGLLNNCVFENKLDVLLSHWIILCEVYGFNIQWHIQEKMKYNELREYKNGKKF